MIINIFKNSNIKMKLINFYKNKNLKVYTGISASILTLYLTFNKPKPSGNSFILSKKLDEKFNNKYDEKIYKDYKFF